MKAFEQFCKAKKKNSDEWIVGYFARAKWFMDEREMFVIFPLDICFFPHSEVSEYEEIDKETICRFTGITDKNRKPIFENDIVKHKYTPFGCDESKTKNYVIKWDSTGAYCGYRYHNGRNIFPFKYGTSWNGNDEVIGNIFDNPELLEGSQEGKA